MQGGLCLGYQLPNDKVFYFEEFRAADAQTSVNNKIKEWNTAIKIHLQTINESTEQKPQQKYTISSANKKVE